MRKAQRGVHTTPGPADAIISQFSWMYCFTCESRHGLHVPPLTALQAVLQIVESHAGPKSAAEALVRESCSRSTPSRKVGEPGLAGADLPAWPLPDAARPPCLAHLFRMPRSFSYASLICFTPRGPPVSSPVSCEVHGAYPEPRCYIGVCACVMGCCTATSVRWCVGALVRVCIVALMRCFIGCVKAFTH